MFIFLKSDDCTWEPASNMSNCKEKVREFFADKNASRRSHTNSSDIKTSEEIAEYWHVSDKSNDVSESSLCTKKVFKRKFSNSC